MATQIDSNGNTQKHAIKKFDKQVQEGKLKSGSVLAIVKFGERSIFAVVEETEADKQGWTVVKSVQ